MAINTWKIWEKFGLKHREIPADVGADLRAIVDYLKNANYDVKELLKLFIEFDKLRKEAKVLTDEELKVVNLKKRIHVFDRIMLRYEYYDHDVEINGKRAKIIAKQLMEDAEKKGLTEELAKIRKEARWTFDW